MIILPVSVRENTDDSFLNSDYRIFRTLKEESLSSDRDKYFGLIHVAAVPEPKESKTRGSYLVTGKG